MNTQEIEKYLEKKLSQNIAQPGKFPQTVKEYLIEYLISTKSNNTDITKEEDFIRLSFFMLKNKMIKNQCLIIFSKFSLGSGTSP